MQKKFLSIGLFLVLSKSPVLAVNVGDTVSKVEEELGKSLGYVTLPNNNQINEYNRGSVRFKDGRVVSFQIISEVDYAKKRESDEKFRTENEAKKRADKIVAERAENKKRGNELFNISEFSGDDKAVVSELKYVFIYPEPVYNSLSSIGGSSGGGSGGQSNPIAVMFYFNVKNTSNESLIIRDITLTRNYPVGGAESKTVSCLKNPVSLSPNVEEIFRMKFTFADLEAVKRFRALESINIKFYNSESSTAFAVSTWQKN